MSTWKCRRQRELVKDSLSGKRGAAQAIPGPANLSAPFRADFEATSVIQRPNHWLTLAR